MALSEECRKTLAEAELKVEMLLERAAAWRRVPFETGGRAVMVAALPLKEHLREQVRRIDAEFDRLVPAESAPPEVIHRAMRYSLFAGGQADPADAVR
jgi:hypothetical protein